MYVCKDTPLPHLGQPLTPGPPLKRSITKEMSLSGRCFLVEQRRLISCLFSFPIGEFGGRSASRDPAPITFTALLLQVSLSRWPICPSWPRTDARKIHRLPRKTMRHLRLLPSPIPPYPALPKCSCVLGIPLASLRISDPPKRGCVQILHRSA